MTNNTRPMMGPGPQPPTPEAIEAFSKLATMFQSMKKEYVPIIKALETLGVNYKTIDVMLDDVPTECIVIPVEELMKREWAHMTGHGLSTQGEVAESDK